eukprot:TRINITY_DN22978_c0_g1_i1.p1 TRINITY_DN22978_c0_g1~~TRINITY_DN22978_c0_g1_i1.p1  ORF type:complete len:325 (+),score=72.91 TRINITY_DN22978_c0_g1_i1:80-1054(+)
MSIAAFGLPGADRVSSLSAGARGGVVAVGFTCGTVSVKAFGTGDAGARHLAELVGAEFGRGPVWVEVDEAEAVVWAAVVDGRVFMLDLEAAGEEGAEFELIGKHEAEVYCACFNAERGYFITADAKGDIAVWNNKADAPQPRRVMNTPTREKWHCVASHGTHVVAARHNPEVFVFDLSGAAHEVRSLTGDATVNPRQIRSLRCLPGSFLVGYSDGSLQEREYAAASAHNPFRAAGDTLRTVVHKTDDVHHPLAHISSTPRTSSFVTSGGDGVYRTDLSDPRRPNVKKLLGAPVRAMAGTDIGLVLVAGGRLVEVPWGALAAECP